MPVNPHNLAFWNAVAPQHVGSPLYRTDDFRAGQIVIDPVAREALGGVGAVVGRRLLHLQCHFGRGERIRLISARGAEPLERRMYHEDNP
jgi:hypothetical protein